MGVISNTEDIIDSRDVIERLATLALLHEAGPVDLESTPGGEPGDNEVNQDDLFAEERVLSALAEQGSAYVPDWEYGEALIRDSYFEEYAQELAEDIGAIGKDLPWPASYIDWEAAARALQQDYTALDFDGVTYWAR